jgi:predicted subunit of tRNA(5-methylaminomethyl-2-thiouridylate) methyltransferase
MKVTVLFSGGKDSSLASILLEPFFEVELVTFDYGHGDTWRTAMQAAKGLGYPHRVISFEKGILNSAIDMLMAKGYPKDALNYLHKCALEVVAPECEFVADGTKREDRAPVMDNNEIRSLEDRTDVHYIRPLAGYGSGTINRMASSYLDFEILPSEMQPASDYEVGLRFALAERYGLEEVARVFPANHTHSIVMRRKSFE